MVPGSNGLKYLMFLLITARNKNRLAKGRFNDFLRTFIFFFHSTSDSYNNKIFETGSYMFCFIDLSMSKPIKG